MLNRRIDVQKGVRGRAIREADLLRRGAADAAAELSIRVLLMGGHVALGM